MAKIRIKAAPKHAATARAFRRDVPLLGFELRLKGPRQSASAVATTSEMPGVGSR